MSLKIASLEIILFIPVSFFVNLDVKRKVSKHVDACNMALHVIHLSAK